MSTNSFALICLKGNLILCEYRIPLKDTFFGTIWVKNWSITRHLTSGPMLKKLWGTFCLLNWIQTLLCTLSKERKDNDQVNVMQKRKNFEWFDNFYYFKQTFFWYSSFQYYFVLNFINFCKLVIISNVKVWNWIFPQKYIWLRLLSKL